MGFRFSLATVLRLREIAEEREERLLGQILSQMAMARQTIAELQIIRAQLLERRDRVLLARVAGAELHLYSAQVRGFDERDRALREQLAKLEIARLKQMKVYESAHQGRELLAGMRAEQLEAYRREQTRLEQNAMDDNFASRRALG